VPINRSLAWLHVVEAIGAFAVAALIVVGSSVLGDTTVPRFLAFVPALFGVLFLGVARQVARRHRWRVLYAVWAQGWMIAAGTAGLVFGGNPVFWAVIVMGVAGSALAVVAQKEETAFGGETGPY
jgi:hypothetical protein